jgi:RNA polymerase sigma factor (sigma-70 family)
VATEASRADAVQRVLDTVWRMESGRLVAALTRMVRDVGLAEDLAHDAVEAALRQWPAEGIPDNPAAWLMATARHRAVDGIRRRVTLERKAAEMGRLAEAEQPTPEDLVEAIDNAAIRDDLLRLIFICCHPVLSLEARVALTLRLLGGLTTDEVARAFLSTEPTIAQRIVRAKRTLREARIEFEVPTGPDFDARLASVLQVLYLVFNEGYAATSGSDWVRPALCDDALRLGRVLATLVPDEPEILGLVALMEIQASRLRARTRPDGLPIPLHEQNRARWDRLLIQRGLSALDRALQLGRGASGPYTLQAAIAACHARATSADQTDWEAIVALYDALLEMTPSPVVALNRAVAVGMAEGPAAGLASTDELADEPALRAYHLLPAVRGDALVRLGRFSEGASEFARAASMTSNGPERTFLLDRARRADDQARGR